MAAAGDAGPPRRDAPLPFEGLRYAAAGGVAGAFAKSCTAPLARLTILYQVRSCIHITIGHACKPKLQSECPHTQADSVWFVCFAVLIYDSVPA
jgi:hypothetical protein